MERASRRTLSAWLGASSCLSRRAPTGTGTRAIWRPRGSRLARGLVLTFVISPQSRGPGPISRQLVAMACPPSKTGARDLPHQLQPWAPGVSTPEEPGREASTTPVPGRERANITHKRKWRQKAWQWMITTALLGAAPGGQDPLPQRRWQPQQDLLEHTAHRRQREATKRPEPKGRCYRAWSYNVEALDRGSLQEALQRLR